MNDIAEHVAIEQCFAIEFEDKGARRFMSLRFRKGLNLCRVLVCRSGLPFTELTGELVSVAPHFSVVTTEADIVACPCCPLDLIRIFDEMPSSTHALQSCFRFN